MMSIRGPILASALLAAAAAGCSESTLPVVCTDRGCVNGLLLRFESPLPDGATVSLELGEVPWSVTCGGPVDCSEALFFEGLRADRVTVRVRSGTAERVVELEPAYVLSKPNGPDCPGECFYAEADLPALDLN